MVKRGFPIEMAESDSALQIIKTLFLLYFLSYTETCPTFYPTVK